MLFRSNNQNRFSQNRGYQDNRQQQRDFRNDQPAPAPQADAEPGGLPSFITSPVRVPIADTEPVAQPQPVADQPMENGDGGGYHLRSRRRRRPRGDQGGEGADAGPVAGDVPAGE